LIKAIIIDDKESCETLIALTKEDCPSVQIVSQCCSVKEGFKLIEKIKPNLVFFDIETLSVNVFEMLQQLSQISFSIIFTTVNDQSVIKAIHLSSLNYLLKPFKSKELVAALHKVRTQEKIPELEQLRMLVIQLKQKTNGFQKIAVPTSNGFELITVECLIRCQADDNYTYLFVKNNGTVLACSILKVVEAQLRCFSFFMRVHNSHLVNLNEVLKYCRGRKDGRLVMSDGSSVDISRHIKKLLLKKLQSNSFEKVAVPTFEGLELIPAEEIIMCQSGENHTQIVLKNKITITAMCTLKMIEKLFIKFSFFIRVHHSYLVNLNEVTNYVRGKGGYLLMTNGSLIDVSCSYKKELIEKIHPTKKI
jgi:two-component system LytT family response regulator